MHVTRRSFLGLGGGVVAAALSGCSKSPWLMLPGWQPDLTDTGRIYPPHTEQIDLISHILNRMTFGLRCSDYVRVSGLGATPEEAAAAYLDEQLAPDTIDDSLVQSRLRRLEVLNEPLAEFFEYKEDFLLEQMVRGTLLRAVFSKRQLYEIVVQFWTDHFNIDSSKGECKWLKAADDRDVIRRYAFSTFPELLRASALSPAMLWYLDGRVNQKQHAADKPNENYARELLELHTLGIHGGYSQQDIMEIARCLTGWTVRDRNHLQKGKVEFNLAEHDDGPKKVLGQTIPPGLGEMDLDRVMEMVALHPATAQHLATKLCQRFIAEDPPTEAVNAVASAFLASHGDIKMTLRALFMTEAFRSTRGGKFRRPFEYIAAALRASNADTDAGKPIIEYLVRMGQAPFQYPTPDGYPLRAEPWMGGLLWRWNFAVALTENRLRGTHVDIEAYRDNCGGDNGLMSAILGRLPSIDEKQAYALSGNGMALLLASPSFQHC